MVAVQEYAVHRTYPEVLLPVFEYHLRISCSLACLHQIKLFFQIDLLSLSPQFHDEIVRGHHPDGIALLRLDEIWYRIERKMTYGRTLAVVYRHTTLLRVIKKESVGFLVIPVGAIVVLAERNNGRIESCSLHQRSKRIVVDITALEVDDRTVMVERRNPDISIPGLIDMREYLLFGRKDPFRRNRFQPVALLGIENQDVVLA